MPVVALARLIIVAQQTVSTDNERKSILKTMQRAACRFWQTPNEDLNKRLGIKDVTFVN